MKIILIGYMGSGKTSVGEQLASVLNFPFKDLDCEIETIEGMPISKIFSEKGEIYFRKKENSILKSLLSAKENLVLATGGGTPCYGDSLQYMLEKENSVIVYLKSSINTLSERLLSEKQKRPLLSHLKGKDEVLEFVGKHLFERSHFYNQANFTVNVDDISIEHAVERIILKLF